MPPSSHSSVGASSCERWWNCPGSVALSAKVPGRDASKYAAEGTVAHGLCEISLTKGPAEASLYKGEKMDADGFTFTVGDEMLDAVSMYYNTVMGDAKKYPVHTLLVEESFKLKDVDPDARGTNDAVLIVPFTKIIVYDFKYGAGVQVDAYKNKQLMYYAIGALARANGIEEIELVIVQPRCQGGGVKRWTVSVDELLEFKKMLKFHIAETRKPDAKFTVGKWCKWCPGSAICPAQKNQAENLVQTAFGTPTLPPMVGSIDADQISKILDKKDILVSWLNSVETYAKSLLEKGDKVHGYKLVKRRSNRKWINEKEVIASYASKIGEKIYKKTLVSPAQLEKLAGKTELEKISSMVFKPEAGSTIVSESDSRQAIETKPIFNKIRN